MVNTLTILPDPPVPPAPVGVIAAAGDLPLLVAEGLAALGHPVHGIGFTGLYHERLPGLCETFREIGLFRVGTWGRRLRSQGVRHAIMVGKVDKAALMHDRLKLVRHVPDLRTMRTWYRRLRHDRRSYAVLGAIAEELARDGVHLIDSTMPIPDHLSVEGVMSRTRPTEQQQKDIEFVWPLLTEMLRLDIGQAVAVRDRDVIAVEAVEGTDRMIERAGQLCRNRGWTLCKGARVGHDRRSDVPTVGPNTLHNLHANGARCLALAADDVIMIDKPRLLELADELNIAIVGVAVGPTATTTASREVEPGPDEGA
ncbi:MAG: UDP-2,3-diacylglucosamine diphosphatase LpxI [Planctomycetota bacterium]